ncbi:hypothetical protein PENTCL1PPCAC_14964, partial [Pristionchus entomophagus]
LQQAMNIIESPEDFVSMGTKVFIRKHEDSRNQRASSKRQKMQTPALQAPFTRNLWMPLEWWREPSPVRSVLSIRATKI